MVCECGKAKHPLFNLPGQKKGLYCSKCKPDGAVDVVNPMCKCGKHRPTYGLPGTKTATACKECKTDDLVDIRSRRCFCKKRQPTYGFPDDKKATRCSECALQGMINKVVRYCKTCKKTRARYGLKGTKIPVACMQCHDRETMVDVTRRMCKCGKHRPTFNFPGEKRATHCRKCRTEDMVDISNRHKQCLTPFCDVICHVKKYRGYCSRCFVFLFPDEPNTRNYKTKEKAVGDFITEKIPDIDWVSDKTVRDGCSRRRPDLLADMGSHVIIIEVDENAHSSYDCSCENKRTMELSRDVGHRPIVFIRFNPDSYKVGLKTKRSCWGVHKGNGLAIVKNKKEWALRLMVLEEQVRYWCDNPTQKTIETVQLFFDQ